MRKINKKHGTLTSILSLAEGEEGRKHTHLWDRLVGFPHPSIWINRVIVAMMLFVLMESESEMLRMSEIAKPTHES